MTIMQLKSQLDTHEGFERQLLKVILEVAEAEGISNISVRYLENALGGWSASFTLSDTTTTPSKSI